MPFPPTPLRLPSLLAFLLALATPLGALTLRVHPSATGANNGTSWTDAFPDLQSALLAASHGDELWVAGGTYYPDLGIGQTANNRNSTFALRSDIGLYGGFAGFELIREDRNFATHPTILSGDLLQNNNTTGSTLDDAYHVVTGNTTGPTAILDGFFITSGNANGAAPNNGGGGLICNGGGSPTIRNCAFLGNFAVDLGGAAYINLSSAPSFTNCTFSGNQASFLGGAMCLTNSSTPTLTNCTFAKNSATGLSGFGGALYSSPSSGPTLTNAILWNNSATTDGNQIHGPLAPGSSHNLVEGTLPGGHVVANTDPLFIRNPHPGPDGLWTGLLDNDYGDLQLQAASPARELGLNAANTTNLDLAARSRHQNGLIDLGAYEIPLLLTVTSPNDSGPGSLRATIASIPTPGGATITFDPTLDGQTITLGSGQLLLDRSLVIDGSTLPAGITIDANQSSRVFEITVGQTVVLNTVTLRGGKTADGATGANGTDNPGGTGGPGAPGIPSGNGGGILNNGSLTLLRVTLHDSRTGKGGNGGNGGSGSSIGTRGSGSASGHGGGIYNGGILHLLNSTFADNQTGNGGIAGFGSGIAFAGASGSGGGIYNTGSLTIRQSTITGSTIGNNGAGSAPTPGSGGGIKQLNQLILDNSIIAENSSPTGGPDLDGNVNLTSGINFVGNLIGSSGLGPALLTGLPLLGPLEPNGGPTITRRPSFDSPLVDPLGGDSTSRFATDQRGLPRITTGVADIGAVEAFLSTTVTSTADSGPGSLRKAITDLETGGLVTFHPSLDGGTILLSSGPLLLNKSILIDASSLPSGFTIDANLASRALTIEDGNDLFFRNVTLSNLTITGGSSTSHGGAISNRENLTLLDCTIDSNSCTGSGGGLWLALGTSTLDHCILSNNSADGTGGGGGIRLEAPASLLLTNSALTGNSTTNPSPASLGGGALTADSGSALTATSCNFHQNSSASFGGALVIRSNPVTLTDCTLTTNAAQHGGAIHLLSASPVLTRCRFRENNATVRGGALYLTASSAPTVNNSSFSGNWSGSGGALSHDSASPSYINCAFAGNQASTNGGASHHTTSSTPAFTNCSFAANRASNGGAIHSDTSTPTLTHCILWGNTATSANPQLFGPVHPSSSANLIQNGSGPHVLLTADPHFAKTPHPGPDATWTGPADNDYGSLRLIADSPALNAGNNATYDAISPVSTDLAGKPRKIGTIDLGAFEGPYLNFAYLYPALDPAGDANDNGLTNFLDYASGADPTAPHDPNTIPSINGNQLTFSHRPEPAIDTVLTFQQSPDLIIWEPMLEGADYTISNTTINGPQTILTLQLLPPFPPGTSFYRQQFSIAE